MHRGILNPLLWGIIVVFLLEGPSAFGNRGRRGFYFPGLFLPETELMLGQAPIFLRFQHLVVELNRLSFELRREAFRESARLDYQRVLNEAFRAQRELTDWLREQRVAPEEIDKLQGLVVSQVDSAPSGAVASESEGNTGEAALPVPVTNPFMAFPGGIRPSLALPVIPNQVSSSKKNGLGTLTPVPTVRKGVVKELGVAKFRGDPKETLSKFGQLLTRPKLRNGEDQFPVPVEAPPRSPKPVERSVYSGEVGPSPLDPSSGLAGPDLRAAESAGGGETELLPADPTGLSAETDSADKVASVVHRLGSLRAGVSSRGNWLLIFLLVAILFALPSLFRNAVLAVVQRGERPIDFTAIPSENDELSVGPRFSADSSFSVCWDGALYCWVLMQRLGSPGQIPVPRVVAELRDGTVVYGHVLGRPMGQRYKLTDQDEWLPTDEPERLVLEVKESLRRRA